MIVQMLQDSTPRNQFNPKTCSTKTLIQAEMTGKIQALKNIQLITSNLKKHSTYTKNNQPLKSLQLIENIQPKTKQSIYKKH